MIVDHVSNSYSVKLQEIFDVAHNLPDEVWFNISNQVTDNENQSEKELPSSQDTAMNSILNNEPDNSILDSVDKSEVTKSATEIYDVMIASRSSSSTSRTPQPKFLTFRM